MKTRRRTSAVGLCFLLGSGLGCSGKDSNSDLNSSKSGVGESCSQDDTCRDGNYCMDQSVCVPNDQGHEDENCFDGSCVDGLICIDDTCRIQAAHCEDGDTNDGETDVDCGGWDCPPCSRGQSCYHDSDCKAFLYCGPNTGRCTAIPLSCFDGLLSAHETSVDCGGYVCPRCSEGLGCRAHTDCEEGLKCRDELCSTEPDHCFDGRHNETEIDVDCGGPDCPGCAAGEACDSSRDCTYDLVCTGGSCAEPPDHCRDWNENEDESSTDCGGTACHPCALEDQCVVDGDCGWGLYCFETDWPFCAYQGTGQLGQPCAVDNSGSGDCQQGACIAGICEVTTCERIDLTGYGRTFEVDFGEIDNKSFLIHGGEFLPPAVYQASGYTMDHEAIGVLGEHQPSSATDLGIRSVAISDYGFFVSAGEESDGTTRMHVWNESFTHLDATEQPFRVASSAKSYHGIVAVQTEANLELRRTTLGGSVIDTLVIGDKSLHELRDLIFSDEDGAVIAAVARKDVSGNLTGGCVEVWYDARVTRYADGWVTYALADDERRALLVSRSDPSSLDHQLAFFDTEAGPHDWTLISRYSLAGLIASDEEVSAVAGFDGLTDIVVGIKKSNNRDGGRVIYVAGQPPGPLLYGGTSLMSYRGTLDDLAVGGTYGGVLAVAGTDEIRLCDAGRMDTNVFVQNHACHNGDNYGCPMELDTCFSLVGYPPNLCSTPCSGSCELEDMICVERADAPGSYGCAHRKLVAIR